MANKASISDKLNINLADWTAARFFLKIYIRNLKLSLIQLVTTIQVRKFKLCP